MAFALVSLSWVYCVVILQAQETESMKRVIKSLYNMYRFYSLKKIVLIFTIVINPSWLSQCGIIKISDIGANSRIKSQSIRILILSSIGLYFLGKNQSQRNSCMCTSKSAIFCIASLSIADIFGFNPTYCYNPFWNFDKYCLPRSYKYNLSIYQYIFLLCRHSRTCAFC
jgi:hypothetical protein